MSYSSTPSQRPKRSGCGCGGLIVILLVVAAIYTPIRFFLDKANYPKGHQAYLQGDCETAVESLGSIVTSPRLVDLGGYVALAEEEYSECWAFQAAEKKASGDPGGAILAYNDFLFNHANGPLAAEASHRIETVFLQTEADRLATRALCDQLESFEQGNPSLKQSSRFPGLILECAHTYEGIQAFSTAIELYNRFLDEYPQDELASAAEISLIRAIVADARESEAGTIPPPERSGSTSGGSTVVIIRNDSPERLRIVFSGPESRMEELSACSSCTTYSGMGPMYCPEQGPVGRYTLAPGQYDVVVQSISDTGITPWTGDWDLASGDEYSSCFYITETTYP